MSNFCQEYSTLLKQLESLHTEVKEALSISEKSRDTAKVRSVLKELAPTKQNIEELLESTTTLEDGREIKKIELIGLQQIASSLGAQVNDLDFIIKNNQIKRFNSNDKAFSDLAPITLFKGIRQLALDGTSVEDINPLRNLTYLTNISLADTDIESIDALSNLVNLESINIAITKVSNIDQLINLTKLKILNIASTKVKSIDVLVKVKEQGGLLEDLIKRRSPVNGDMVQKDNFTRLRELGVMVHV